MGRSLQDPLTQLHSKLRALQGTITFPTTDKGRGEVTPAGEVQGQVTLSGQAQTGTRCAMRTSGKPRG